MGNPVSHSDEMLVELAREGSESAFNELVDRYTPLIYRRALSMTRSSQDAEDVVQETFLRMYNHLGDFSPDKASFKTWLLTIARNQSINVFASLKRKALRFVSNPTSSEPDVAESADSLWNVHQGVEKDLGTKQELSRVEKGLQALPERQRTALLLKAQDQMSYEEISEIMGVSVSSVESLIFRARRKLVDLLEE
jgi:RNA polymerase sigma-70 factor (ECF subfamily)